MLPLILSLCISKKSLASAYFWPSLGGGKEQQGLPQLSLLQLLSPPLLTLCTSPKHLGGPSLSVIHPLTWEIQN